RARGRLLLGRVPARSGGAVPRAGRVRRALPAGLLRGRRPVLRRAAPRPPRRLPAAGERLPLRVREPLLRPGRDAVPGQPAEVRPEVGGRARDPTLPWGSLPGP